MRSWISLGLLATAVIALGAWLYMKPAAREAETHALSPLKGGDVKRVRLERGDEQIVLERRDATWRMTAPFAARADTFQIGRLLSILGARSAVRYPASNLARFGLEPPLARLTIEDESFGFGAINTTTREQYVLTGDSVYLAPLGPGAALPRDAQALLARELFAPDESPVRLELPHFTAALEDGSWRIQPANSEASADERTAWAHAWQNAIALRAARHEGPQPAEAIKVTLKNGASLALGIARREPELVLVRPDEGVAFHFAAATAKRLLSPPGPSDAPAK